MKIERRFSMKAIELNEFYCLQSNTEKRTHGEFQAFSPFSIVGVIETGSSKEPVINRHIRLPLLCKLKYVKE